ncbi:phosphoribosylamine-glycine ligase/phosphoribosylformylglycinamidine cyclo-ligase [Schizosaccharomyces osmophilus]|uniref:Phosphoribosylamine-glycine ligase/phosphoribosylformylglycinamidine cyclo-ligase n=1 Tax=Schizosaccharomyces osmophilus TaxID=2545709 RepID=A0AAE9WAI9_9SCHI|nr:phosphoribosylamine-glycine ligase/phosphoribosylformylglycinamidine cyclo-ligase [Schizosaccharomyces osmophilus]WBW72630.1 phosphoribosylamine-glycine ligase/phosphoribosylformylglycinamidine cyclo-ligase [Schizosaccharomyces osmophilus]
MEPIVALLIGNGGREHALAWKLAQSPLVSKIYVAPGTGGTEAKEPGSKIENANIGVCDFEKLVQFSLEKKVNLAVPGPELPLVQGIETHFRKAGIPCFGPSSLAARMEGSKVFAKDFMHRNNIPTAVYRTFSNYKEAEQFVNTCSFDVVIKADGLAGGKGVIIPKTKHEAASALRDIMLNEEFGSAGKTVVIEELLVGEELSILTFTDGYTCRSLPPAQDHKRAFDGDLGPNTGGMGAYAPAPIATSQLVDQIHSTIIQPTVDGMRREGYPLVGILFTGLMITAQGPRVLEYNVRFGDPETQAVLPLLESDLAEIIVAAFERRLDSVDIIVANKFSCAVVCVAGGYPGSYPKGDPITFSDTPNENIRIFHAGTSFKEGQIVTSGGRVLAVNATGETVESAVKLAYEGVQTVQYKDMSFRKDIAHHALKPSTAFKESLTYETAGVSVDNGNEFVQRIKEMVKSTRRPGADADIGGFGGVFDLKRAGWDDPLLVSATDGVGSKLLIALHTDKHDTVGIDLVAMNVNDLVVQGAEPLIFLDYFATGKLDLPVSTSFVEGVVNGCKQAGCALVGGETSEMPGLYHEGHYDANGTSVGAVSRQTMLPNYESFRPGDVLLGLGSDGVHSNGYSLVRRIVDVSGLDYNSKCPWDDSTSLGISLLTPTRIYVKPLLQIIKKGLINGMAHITGGGLVENVPRMLPKQFKAVIDANTWKVPEVFKWLQRTGNVPVSDMARTFNMGIGMVVVVPSENAEEAMQDLSKSGETVYRIGTLVENTDQEQCNLLNLSKWEAYY